MTRRRPATRVAGVGAVGLAVLLLAAVGSAPGLGGAPSTLVFRTVDTGLCRFPLQITIESKEQPSGALGFWLIGPSTITLRDGSSGRRAVLSDPGSYAVARSTGTLTFSGRRIWFSPAGHVPFLETSGEGSMRAPDFVLSSLGLRARVIDPCALVEASPSSTQPVTTAAPWGLPADALSQISRAGLTPLLGTLVRHDHVHLDVIVNGRKVPVPAGIGQAEPVDRGPCPLGQSFGDCATGHFFTAQVANSPLHTHSASGIIHIESDRPGPFTLGEFFTEWGVRLNARCLGGYCSGNGKRLRVYIDGARVAGDPQRIVLTNKEEIAVVFGGPGDVSAIPSGYGGGWPGAGCGGAGERSCLPP